MAHGIKDKKLLNYHDIIQSWIRNEDKNVNIESIKNHLKISSPICIDEIKFEILTICDHIFCKECIYGVITTQNNCLICQENVHRVYIQFNLE
jgi:hypothetical protein